MVDTPEYIVLTGLTPLLFGPLLIATHDSGAMT
jgi:hypothetical protein